MTVFIRPDWAWDFHHQANPPQSVQFISLPKILPDGLQTHRVGIVFVLTEDNSENRLQGEENIEEGAGKCDLTQQCLYWSVV